MQEGRYQHCTRYRLEFPSTTTIHGTRTYHIGDNDYPSITTILGARENVGLNAWVEAVGKSRADKIKQQAAARGSAVHDLIERYMRNEAIDLRDLDTAVSMCFGGLRVHLHSINNILCQENVLFSDTLKVAGRVDCIAEVAGKLSIIDFKTSTSGSLAEDLIESYCIQASAYAFMFYEMFEVEIEQIVIMVGAEKGMPSIIKRNPADYYNLLVDRIREYYDSRK